MKVRGTKYTSFRRPIASKVINFATSAIISCVGFFISFPYVYKFFILGINVHYFSVWDILSACAFMVGAPMFIGGIIGVLSVSRRGGIGSLTEGDVARIRYSVENEARKQ
jgi:hypothetical protein